jgi:hypothetical protein
MEKYKITDTTPPDFCSPTLLQKLKEAGIETDGSIVQMEEIIRQNGYNLPGKDGEHFGFIFHPKKLKQTYTRLYLTYPSALAEEILMLKRFKMLKK